jgi:hypothetical protein
MNTMRILGLLSFCALLSVCQGSFAQEDTAPAPAPVSKKSSAATVRDKRRQTLDFEDELIQGDVKKPELFYLMQKKQFNFKRLIKLREDFIPEMKRNSEEVQRAGGRN